MLRVAVQADTGLMLTLTEYVAEPPRGSGLGVCAPTVGVLRPAPAVMSKEVLVAVLSPLLVAVKVKPLPDVTLEILQLKNEAVPPVAVSGLDEQPESTPPLGFVPIASVIDAELVVTVLPPAS